MKTKSLASCTCTKATICNVTVSVCTKIQCMFMWQALAHSEHVRVHYTHDVHVHVHVQYMCIYTKHDVFVYYYMYNSISVERSLKIKN